MCAVLEAIREQAAANHFSRVYRVALAVGELCNVEVEAVVFCFDLVVQGTIAEGAALEIVAVPGAGWCQQCRQTFRASSRSDPCPFCGTWDVTMSGGDQLIITALEVE